MDQTGQQSALTKSEGAPQTWNAIRLQRRTTAPPPASVECTPPGGSPYARFPSDLRETLCRSFRERTEANKYLDNGFWSSTKPINPWDALNQYRVADLNSLVEIYQGTKTIGGLWNYVRDIREAWSGGSRGFRFTPTNIGELAEKFFGQNTNFCEDTGFGGLLHIGHRCWREVVSGSPGLHVCLDEKLKDEADNEIHIDLHQTVRGRTPEGKCKYDTNPFGVWGEHMRDVAGLSKSVFERFDESLKRARDLDKRVRPSSIDYREFKEAYARLNQLIPYMRQQAARGVQGEKDAEQRIGDVVVEIWVTLKKIYDRSQGRRLDSGESWPF